MINSAKNAEKKRSIFAQLNGQLWSWLTPLKKPWPFVSWQWWSCPGERHRYSWSAHTPSPQPVRSRRPGACDRPRTPRGRPSALGWVPVRCPSIPSPPRTRSSPSWPWCGGGWEPRGDAPCPGRWSGSWWPGRRCHVYSWARRTHEYKEQHLLPINNPNQNYKS